MLKRAHDVSDRERLIMETWMGAFPQLLAAWIDDIPQGQREVWKGLVSAVSGWREEMLT